ncbi:LexA family protein [Pseudomonas sp. W5-36]|uniref:LexA family protein n=1 Tax=Pseudomonas sp. W5-36 TaxID=3097455 RepID=UPI003977E6A8
MQKCALNQMQAITVAFIGSYITQNGHSPTITEMAKDANVDGNTISTPLNALLKKGAITKVPSIAHSI